MAKSKFGYKYNLKRDEHKTEHKRFKDFLRLKGAQELPKSVNLISKFNPITNQFNLGACSAFSAGSNMEYLYGNPFISSKLYIYYNGRAVEGSIDEDSGCSLEDQVDQLKVNGICNTNKWDYDVSKFTEKPPENCYEEGKQYLAGESYRVESIDEMKQALAMGLPIYVGIAVFQSFESDECINTGVVPFPSGEELGGHAILLVAYNIEEESCSIKKFFKKIFGIPKEKTTFILRNSWGTDVGLPDNRGYFKIDDDVLEKLLMDAWVLVKK